MESDSTGSATQSDALLRFQEVEMALGHHATELIRKCQEKTCVDPRALVSRVKVLRSRILKRESVSLRFLFRVDLGMSLVIAALIALVCHLIGIEPLLVSLCFVLAFGAAMSLLVGVREHRQARTEGHLKLAEECLHSVCEYFEAMLPIVLGQNGSTVLIIMAHVRSEAILVAHGIRQKERWEVTVSQVRWFGIIEWDSEYMLDDARKAILPG